MEPTPPPPPALPDPSGPPPTPAPPSGRPGPLVDRLLRHPLLLLSDLERRPAATGAGLLALAAACYAAYGAIMGSFSGGAQWGVVPLKVLAIAALAPLVCLPSLHILSSLEGGRQTLGQCAAALAMGAALNGLLLLGFAPVAWVFSQSTDTVAFMGLLHLLFLALSLGFGLRLTRRAMAGAGGRATSLVFPVWALLFLTVCFQMGTAVRPLLGPFEELRLAEKQCFAAHWLSTLEQGLRGR